MCDQESYKTFLRCLVMRSLACFAESSAVLSVSSVLNLANGQQGMYRARYTVDINAKTPS